MKTSPLAEKTDPTMSQTDVVVNGIKRMILDGTLAPGARLPIEKDLADRLGVSRSSLREGVRALSSMGVLDTRQGAGTFVTSLDASLLLVPMSFLVDVQLSDGLQEVHSVRRVLETEAALRAALTMSPEAIEGAREILDRSALAIQEGDDAAVIECDLQFHRAIATAAGNNVLAAMIEALSSRTVRGRTWRQITDENAALATLAEHRAILRAIAERDPDAARTRMANHLLEVEEFLQDRPPINTPNS